MVVRYYMCTIQCVLVNACVSGEPMRIQLIQSIGCVYMHVRAYATSTNT